ncbi:MAG: TIGR03984 family CRISPR-associated protein [Acidobacteria bacterium]|nr:TIGR03984 family CRISPR-associated protein [Acidobacteriota bacterium]
MTDTNSGTLWYWQSPQPVSLTQALSFLMSGKPLSTPLTALLYSPQACQFGVVDNQGNILGPDGKAIELQTVFEARAFGEIGELRWLQKHSGQGPAVFLTENKEFQCDGFNQPSPKEFYSTISQTYLLWGKSLNKPDLLPGWSLLAEARIGKLPVPVENLKPSERVQINAREYIAIEKPYGNAFVFEERLINLEVAQNVKK